MTARPKIEGWGEITDAHLETLLKRLHVPRTERGALMRGFLAPNQWDSGYGKANFFISRESAGRFARGFADENPLYVDLAYAERSPWGRMLAPSSLLAYAESVNGATDGFPGCHAIWRECEFEWNRPLYAEEPMNVSTELTGARIVDSNFAGGRAAVHDYETKIVTLEDEAVATYRTSWHRFSRKKATGESKYGKIEQAHWSEDALASLWDEYRRQNKSNRRGDVPLYFEDVAVGTDVPYIVKGPVTLTGKLAFEFCRGAGGWFVGHEMALDLFERYPALAIRNEENVPEPPVAIHWTNERCRTYLGMPGAYEAGFERLAWYTQLLTSWIGDHGCLRALKLRFLAFHWQGDAIRLYATVTGKRTENGKHLVDLAIRSVSHPRGEETSAGTATVELPSRAGQQP